MDKRAQKIDGYDVGHLLKTAAKAVLNKTADSHVLDKEAEDRIPKFDIQGTLLLISFLKLD